MLAVLDGRNGNIVKIHDVEAIIVSVRIIIGILVVGVVLVIPSPLSLLSLSLLSSSSSSSSSVPLQMAVWAAVNTVGEMS